MDRAIGDLGECRFHVNCLRESGIRFHVNIQHLGSNIENLKYSLLLLLAEFIE